MGFAKPIEQYLFGNQIHVFMYLKDIIREENGYEGYMLVEAEQDPAKANPLEYAIKARKFIREKTGL